MGRAKDEAMRLEGLRESAIVALTKAGLVQECEYDLGTLVRDYNEDLGPAYAIGTNMWKAKEVDGDRAEFMDAIKSTYADIGYECPFCAKRASE